METITTAYRHFIDDRDRRLDGYPLMGSVWPTLILVSLYVLGCFAGPRFMENRKGYNPKKLMLCYNVTQILLSLFMFVQLLYWGALSGHQHFFCAPVDVSDGVAATRIMNLVYLFLLTKYFEFFDTLFFILKKNNRQVTFLHVYHHACVPITFWVCCQMAPGGSIYLTPLLNSFVHFIMYFYYALSSLGEGVKRYLWWKRYVTWVQLAQFGLFIAQSVYLLLHDCGFPALPAYINLYHGVVFMALFSKFYVETYFRGDKHEKRA